MDFIFSFFSSEFAVFGCIKSYNLVGRKMKALAKEGKYATFFEGVSF